MWNAPNFVIWYVFAIKCCVFACSIVWMSVIWDELRPNQAETWMIYWTFFYIFSFSFSLQFILFILDFF